MEQLVGVVKALAPARVLDVTAAELADERGDAEILHEGCWFAVVASSAGT